MRSKEKICYMEERELNFTLYCVGIVAERLGKTERDIYDWFRKVNLIDDYIVPCFDVLHTFSRDYIIDDLLCVIKKREGAR